MNQAKKLINLLIKNNLTISSVESLTAGLFISTLCEIPHASSVVRGALVTYQSSFKTKLLGIKKEHIDKYGVVSEEIANMMAKAGKKISNTDIVISFTGNAGPTVEKDGKEVGRVYSTIIGKLDGFKLNPFTKIYKGDRNTIRKLVVDDAIKRIIKYISATSTKKLGIK